MKHVIYFILFLFLISSASAIGVSPAIHETTFEPGLSYTIEYQVMNNAGRDMFIEMSFGGDLSQYARIIEDEVFVKAGKSAPFHVEVNLPDEVEKPGKHIIKLYLLEKQTGGGVSARTGVVPWIVVHVPYPGRYAEISGFQVAEGEKGINKGEQTPLVLQVSNRGDEAIVNTHAKVYIKHVDGELIESYTINDIDILPKEDYSTRVWMNTTQAPSGVYQAFVEYYYDDLVRERKKQFIIGGFNFSLSNYKKQLPLEGNVQFYVEVTNQRKGEVDVEAAIITNNGDVSETPRKRFSEFQTDKLYTYINTNALGLGNHSANVTLSFGKVGSGKDEFVQQTYPITIEIVEPKPEEPVQEKTSSIEFSPIMIIIVIMILVLLVNAIILLKVFGAKKKSDIKPPKEP